MQQIQQDITATIKDLSSWINPQFGPIIDMDLSLFANPRWWIYSFVLARPTDPSRIWNHRRFSAAGGSIDKEEALIRALGEAVERYTAMDFPYHRKNKMIPADHPDSIFHLYSRCALDEPCPKSLKTSQIDYPFSHFPVKRLGTTTTGYAPTSSVHLNFSTSKGEPLVYLPISTGLAYHYSPWRALWAGLCEVVERDAMMVMWWLQRAVSRIQITAEDAPWPLYDRVQRVAKAGIGLYLFDISTDIRLPAVFCLSVTKQYPYVTAGAACKSDIATACAKAIDEAISIRWHYTKNKKPKTVNTENWSWVQRLNDHADLYANWSSTEAFHFLLESAAPTVSLAHLAAEDWWPGPESLQDVHEISQRMGDLGMTVWSADLQFESDLIPGHVMKIIVPELLPLSQSHSVRWLASKRITQLAEWMSGHGINRYPHPFA